MNTFKKNDMKKVMKKKEEHTCSIADAAAASFL